MHSRKLKISGAVIIIVVMAAIIYMLFGALGITSGQGTKKQITIKTESKEKMYDATPLTSDQWFLLDGSLKDGEKISFSMPAAITNVGTTTNLINITVKDKNNRDVTNKYDVKYILGDLTVKKKELVIQTEKQEKEYDGEVMKSDKKYVVTDDGLIEGHQVDFKMTSSIIEVGEKINEVVAKILDEKNNDVTDNYSIVYKFDNLKINKKQLTVKTESLSKEYDGIELKSKDATIDFNKLVKNHKAIVTMKSSMTDVGEIDNKATVKVYDAHNQDVTAFYEILEDFGKLEITKKSIIVTTSSIVKVYDGKATDDTKYDIDTDILDEIRVISTTSISDITPKSANAKNAIEINFYRENKNVTKNYDIHYNYGNIEIKEIELAIISASETKVFDGTPLVKEEAQIITFSNDKKEDKSELLEGHAVKYGYFTSITEPGSIENRFIATIWSNTKEDVSRYYKISYKYGTLSVLTSIYDTGVIQAKMPQYQRNNILNVESSKSGLLYLRERSWGNYENNVWTEGKNLTFDSKLNPLYYTNQSINKNVAANEEQVKITYLRDQIPYLAPYYTINDHNQTNDVYTKSKKLESITHNYVAYEPSSKGYKELPQEYLSAENDYKTQVLDEYLRLNISSELDQKLDEIIRNMTIDQQNPNQLLKDIKRIGNLIKEVSRYNKNFKLETDKNNQDYLLEFLKGKSGGVNQHFASVGTLIFRKLGIPARYTTGYYVPMKNKNSEIIFEENAHAWVEVYIEKMGWIPVEVTPGISDKSIIRVTPTDITMQYQGSDMIIPEDKYEYTVQNFEEYTKKGYKIFATINKSNIKVGKSDITVSSVTIKDANNNDITDDFEVDLGKGTLHLYLEKLEISSDGGTFEYSGSEHTVTTYKMIGSLRDNHREKVKFTQSIIDTGVIVNRIDVKIYSGNENVTDYYLISKKEERITVTHKKIVIKSGSKTKSRDGQPLVYKSIELKMGLIDGHDVRVTFTGEQNGLGSSENTFNQVKIYDQNDTDVTKNYEIVSVYGILEIIPQ